jgi:hypothetical protein
MLGQSIGWTSLVLLILLSVGSACGSAVELSYPVFDCDSDGVADCYSDSLCLCFDLFGNPEPATWYGSCVYVGTSNRATSLPKASSSQADCRCKGTPASSSPSVDTLAPWSPPPASPVTITLGDNKLEVTDLVKCRYFQGRPYASLIIRLPGQEAWLTLPDVVVDSGADVTSFPVGVAGALGLSLSACERLEFTGVGGTTYGYLGTIEVGVISLGSADEELDGYIIGVDQTPYFFEIPVAFLAGDDHNGLYLLGREEVLRHLTITFEQDMVTIQVKDPS